MEKIAKHHLSRSSALPRTRISSDIGAALNSTGLLWEKKPYFCKPRIRDDYLVLYTLDGEAWVEEDGRRKNLKKYSWTLLRPGFVHSYEALTPWTFAYAHFGGTAIDSVFEYLVFFERDALLFRQAAPEAERLLMEIVRTLDDLAPTAEIRRIALLLELISVLHKNYEAAAGSDTPLDSVLKFMNESFSEYLSLDDLAEYASMSRFHFSRVFKQKTACSPMQYLRRIRVEKAREMIADASSEHSISDIARMCGFQDPLYFSKVFRSSTGMSPVAYRNYINQEHPV